MPKTLYSLKHISSDPLGRDFSSRNTLLDSHFLTEAFQGVPLLQLCQFNRRMLVQELVDGHVATTDPDLDLVLFDPHVDAFGAELVDAFAFTHEH